jgi:two-component system sensor histidine kinase AdeS
MTAAIIVAMMGLSVVIVYFGVLFADQVVGDRIIASLPDGARRAWIDSQAGRLPDKADFEELHAVSRAAGAKAETSNRLAVAMFSALSIAVFSLGGFMVMRRVLSPLKRLADATERVRSGDFDVRLPASRLDSKEIATLVDGFNALANDLDAAERRLRFNTMALAHELRTPLTVVQTTLQAMIDDVYPIEVNTIRPLLTQIEGLGQLVEDLRVLSLAAGNRLLLEATPGDLAVEVATLAASIAPAFEARGVSLKTALEAAPALIDSQRMRQVLLALVENARIHAADGRHIGIVTGLDGHGRAVASVFDRGPGFPDELLQNGIVPFFKGSPFARPDHRGTGLGLSIVRAIVLAHGGELRLENRPDGGGAVHISLPPLDPPH